MGLWDVLRGERRQPKADLDRLFAMSTAALTLEVNLSLAPFAEGAVCFKPVSSGDFAQAQGEVDEILAATPASAGATIRSETDALGFRWLVVADPELEGLVATMHSVNGTLAERGYSEQLLCSVFGFSGAAAGPVYLVYSFKRGNFYPFVPRGGRERDNVTELRLRAQLGEDLPIEPDLARWYPVWDVPIRPAARPSPS